MTNHDHVKQFIDLIVCIRVRWVSRRWQNVLLTSNDHDVRRMSTTSTFCVERMHRTTLEGIDRIIDKSTFVQ